MADNYRVDVISDKREVFDAAMQLAFMTAGRFSTAAKAKFWTVRNGSLILAQWVLDGSEQADKFPMDLTVESAIPFCWEWLMQQPYPKEPDHDGSNKRGFWVTSTDAPSASEAGSCWYLPGGYHGGIVRVTPVWCMYGK